MITQESQNMEIMTDPTTHKDSDSYPTDDSIEQYARTIFKELIRLQNDHCVPQDINVRYISPFTFYQYSKLPKLMSDRVFKCISKNEGWNCSHLIQWLKLEINGSKTEKQKALFNMLDFSEEGSITQEHCRVLLTHTLGSPAVKTQTDISNHEKRTIQIIGIISTDKRFAISPTDFDSICEDPNIQLYSEVSKDCNPQIWNFIKSTMKSQVKVARFQALRESCFNPSNISALTSRNFEKKIQHTRSKSNIEENKLNYVLCEGKMCRMVGTSSIKHYYYRLVNSELFVYRSQKEDEWKSVTYLGHAACLKTFIPEFKTKAKDEQLFGLQLLSGTKLTKFYFLSMKDYLMWKIKLEELIGVSSQVQQDFEAYQEIESGKSYQIRRAVHLKTGQKVALKIIDKSKLDPKGKQQVREEIEVMKMARHPNLVKLEAIYEDFDRIYLALQYFENGSLKDYCKLEGGKVKRIDHQTTLGIAHQMGKALQYLKNMNVIHRDIRAENIKLTGKLVKCVARSGKDEAFQVPQVKLTNFTVSKIVASKSCDAFQSSITHKAPEILYEKSYSYSADMYSLGVVLFECMIGKQPFSSSNVESLKHMISKLNPRYWKIFPSEVPYFVVVLIKCKRVNKLGLLNKEEDDRLSLEALLAIPEIEIQ